MFSITRPLLAIALILSMVASLPVSAAPSAGFASAPPPVKNKAKAGQTESDKYRLPDSVVPAKYDLYLEPDISKFSFSGSETIEIHIVKPTDKIVMNALELQITDAGLTENSDGRTGRVGAIGLQKLDVLLDPASEKVTFLAKSALQPGFYTLRCKFKGVLNTKLRGFYRAGYEDDAHKKHWLAATQMEPTDARRVFPCFDEPSYKATFRIHVTINKNLVAISNAPVEHEEKVDGDKKTVSFEPSPKMSSYLVNLTYGDLKCTGEAHSGVVPIKVWAVAGKEQLGHYALSEAPKILDFETKYFGLPYLGKKLDLIALPEFSFGGMENVGAITFPDATLLIDDKTGSSFDKQGAFGVMAHEIAHQWFGDLVTMSWWDDLWLNEAFATWMSTKVEDALHPEWRSLTESIFTRMRAMNTDSLKSTRTIHASVTNPSQAVEMIDIITYSKGASVLRMLESFVGNEVFQSGITKYLRDHQFGNAAGEDFWNAISAVATGVPVAAIARTFILQPGYPQVNATVSEGGSEVSLSQYRQLQMGQDKKDPSLWMVPLYMRDVSPSAKPFAKLLSERESRFQLEPVGKPLFINAGGMGYYKTCYDHKHLQKLQDVFEQLKVDEKLVLLNDCSSLVLSGDIAVEDDYNFLHKINSESDPMILSTLVEYLYGPDRYMTPDSRKSYEQLICNTLSPLKAKLDGWNQKKDDTQQTKELRSTVLNLLGGRGKDKRTISEAYAYFAKYLKDKTAVNPDLVETMMAIVTYNGGTKEYEQIMRLWKTAKNPIDAEYALYNLGSFHQPELAARTLALSMSSDVKSQFAVGLMCSVVYNKFTRDIGWAFLKQHWNEIVKKFPPEQLRALGGIGGAFYTPEAEKEIVAWYGAHPIPAAKSDVARMIESLHISVTYYQRYATRIRNWVIAEESRNGKDKPAADKPANKSANKPAAN